MNFEFRRVGTTASLQPGSLLDEIRRLAPLLAHNADADDVHGAFPTDGIELLWRCRLLTAPLPEWLDGIGLGTAGESSPLLREILRAIGRGHLSLGRLYEGHVNAAALVNRYGSRKNQNDLGVEVEAGRIGAVWMAGAPLRLEMTGSKRYRLVGQKTLCSGAGYVRRPLVTAELPENKGSVMLLPKLLDGVRTNTRDWRPLGMRATASGDVDFTGMEIDEEDLVGIPGDYLRSPYFQGGAWRVLAVQLGGLEAVFEEYRKQLAVTAHSRHPIQLARFGEALIALETASHWVCEASRVAEEPFEDAASIDAYVGLSRNAFEGAATTVIEAARKAIGLKAFMEGNLLDRMVRDLSTYLRQPAIDPSLLAAAEYHLQAMPLATQLDQP